MTALDDPLAPSMIAREASGYQKIIGLDDLWVSLYDSS